MEVEDLHCDWMVEKSSKEPKSSVVKEIISINYETTTCSVTAESPLRDKQSSK